MIANKSKGNVSEEKTIANKSKGNVSEEKTIANKSKGNVSEEKTIVDEEKNIIKVISRILIDTERELNKLGLITNSGFYVNRNKVSNNNDFDCKIVINATDENIFNDFDNLNIKLQTEKYKRHTVIATKEKLTKLGLTTNSVFCVDGNKVLNYNGFSHKIVINITELWQIYQSTSYYIHDNWAIAPKGYYWKYNASGSYYNDTSKYELKPLPIIN